MSEDAEEEFTVEAALQLVNDQGDGNPNVLLQHNDWRFVIAEWKFEQAESGYKYGEFEPEISWRSSGTMAKEDWNEALGEAYAKMRSEGGEETPVQDLDEAEFQEEVDLDDMIDREMAHEVYHWVSQNMNITAIESEDEKGDVLIYEGGVWTANGAGAVKSKAIDLLGSHSSTGVSKELLENHIKNRPATNIESDKLGLSNGRVAVKNGLLDLEKGEVVRELQPDDYAITQVPWEYHPDAECPTWETFISESIEIGKQEMIQEYVGYCLLRGVYPYAKALMLLGDGRNGKTTFLNIVEKLLGRDENVMNADLSELAGGRFSAYRLEGKLANINADIEDDEITETSMFKNMTGGDAFQVEQKYGDPYDHQNSAKLIFASNSIPSVDTEEHAFYRRWLLVQFPKKFTNQDDGNPDADPHLTEKLEDEVEGILKWAVEGYQRLLANNGEFSNSRSPEKVRQNWYSYSNPLAKFCREYLFEDRSMRYTTTAKIYETYEKYMEDQPTSAITQQQVTTYIKKKFEDGGNYGPKKDADGESERGFGSVHILPEKR